MSRGNAASASRMMRCCCAHEGNFVCASIRQFTSLCTSARVDPLGPLTDGAVVERGCCALSLMRFDQSLHSGRGGSWELSRGLVSFEAWEIANIKIMNKMMNLFRFESSYFEK